MTDAETLVDAGLFGWDDTPGIVSVHATQEGRATLWRRLRGTRELIRETVRFRPWVLLAHLEDVAHLGAALGDGEASRAPVRHRTLAGPGGLRHLVTADDGRALLRAVLAGASARVGRRLSHLGALEDDSVLALSPEEQYLVASGRTYFRGLVFDDLRRLQFDLETTGLDPRVDRIFMIAVRDPEGRCEVLEGRDGTPAGEAALLRALAARIHVADPDVLENHNLHGFDLPFLDTRARHLGVLLALGRVAGAPLATRAARRGAPAGDPAEGRRVRFVAPGRELIDTLDAVRRYDQGGRDLPGHGLKAVARHLGIAAPDRELVRGDLVHATWRADPARVRRYATDDVQEVAALSRLLGGATFALAQMAPRRYERLADAGAATGVIDPMLVRAYLHAGEALPRRAPGDGTPHTGAALHLFATGVAHRVVKADVASLYPSLMRAHRIGPARDRLGAMLALVDRLVDRRLAAKAAARAGAAGSAQRHSAEAEAAALKIVVNSAYGYLAADGALTRFADVHAANEVTRRGRALLALLCRELEARGVALLEADTDGVYFAVPAAWTEAHERAVVAEVGALLPALVQLDFDGRYAAMLSHEPKNYALLGYDGGLLLRGVAFRSSRSEPFGERFLRQALARVLVGDVVGVRDAYLAMVGQLRARALPTADLASRVRLTKSPAEYARTRAVRRELAYEALLASGAVRWRVGDRIRTYRRAQGEAGLVTDDGERAAAADARDYDVGYYERMLRTTFASRLARAFTPEDFAVVFASPDQYALFAPDVAGIRPVLRRHPIDVADAMRALPEH